MTRRWPSSNASASDGVNTSVANVEAQLRLARCYLDNTTVTPPEDGRIMTPRAPSVRFERELADTAPMASTGHHHSMASFREYLGGLAVQCAACPLQMSLPPKVVVPVLDAASASPGEP
jgi:hypothetical protein